MQDTLSNLYRYQVATRTTSKLTASKFFQGLFSGPLGVRWIAYPGSGTRVAYTFIDPTFPNEDQVRLFDTATGTDRLLETYKDDCPRPLCISCTSTCITALHMTRDGTILYATAGTNYPLHILKTDGSASKSIPIYQGVFAQSGQRVISDNGKVVFTSSAPNGPTFAAQATDVYVMDLDGTNIKQLTHLDLTQHASDAAISADGSHVVFTVNPGAAIRVPQIWSSRIDGTQLHRLSVGDTAATNPSISGDGKSVTFLQDGQVKKMTTLLDVPFAALVQPYPITHFSTSTPSALVMSTDGQQTAIALNNAAIYLTPSGDFIAQWVDLSSLTRVFAPRVLYSVRSAAGYASPSVGSLITAYGANLANEELTVAQSLPLPTSLGGVELAMNGVPLRMQATTPWQINAQIPQTATPGEVGFIARGGDRNATSELRAMISARDPEALLIPGQGFNQAAAVYPGTKTIADKDHPAATGQILELYVIGLGVTTPRVTAGAASPASPPAVADLRPRISIGDREAEVLFAGLVPGLAGVYQVNLRVPSGLAPGVQWLNWLDGSGQAALSNIFVK